MHADQVTLCQLDHIDVRLQQVQRALDQRAAEHNSAREDLKSARERVLDLQEQAQTAKQAEYAAQRSVKRYQDRRASAQRALDTGVGDYEATVRQLEEVGRILDDLETEILEQMEVQDSLQHAIGQAEALVSQRERELEAADARAPGFIDEHEATRTTLKGERAGLMGTLPDEFAQRYEAFRARGRRAVAYIVDKSCNACNRDLMPQQFIELGRDRIITCRNCKRWLAVKE